MARDNGSRLAAPRVIVSVSGRGGVRQGRGASPAPPAAAWLERLSEQPTVSLGRGGGHERSGAQRPNMDTAHSGTMRATGPQRPCPHQQGDAPESGGNHAI